MKMKIFIITLFLYAINSFAGSGNEIIITGIISSVSSENIFVKFETTEGIEIGDTLYIKVGNNFFPAIRVEHKSSTSCAGVSITSKKLEINTILYAFTLLSDPDILQQEVPDSSSLVPVTTTVTQTDTVKKSKLRPLPPLSGKISIQSFSNFTNSAGITDYQRWRYTFQLNANNIGNSKFSYTHYMSFAYRADEWNTVSSDLMKALRVYDMALKYNFNERTFIWGGRHLNNKISNISAIDGFQFETGKNQWSFGAAVGTRPDFKNMEFNSKLFEYGTYISRADLFAASDMMNTLGYFEQTNDFKTDRRFLYFQHSSSVIKNTRVFISTEADIYKKEMGESKTELSLTSLYTSLNIRPSDYFSLNLSYDARKNVIYYETFKTLVDSIIENETRQGFRSRLIIKPVKNLNIGADYGYRYRKGDIKPSNNYGGYISYSQIPGIQANGSIAFSRLSTSFTEGDLWSATLSRPIAYGFDLMLGFRHTNYKFRTGIEDLKQNSASVNLSTYILKPIFLNFTYEGIFEDVRTSGRFLANVTFRF